MELQLPMNNLKQRIFKELKAVAAITAGTFVGVITYMLFLMGHIAIFGWNFGVVFAPLVAGYVEVIIANKICDESTGAVSAFILFIITVIYGFILKNPTFGFNLFTVGISFVIIQAAIPIAVNYFLIVVVLGIISHFLKIFRNIDKKILSWLENKGLINPKTIEESIKEAAININNLDFLFISTHTPQNLDIEEYLGFYEGRIVLKREDKLISEDPEEDDKKLLEFFQGSQDKALAILAENIKKDSGNGVIDLSIEFDLVGLGGSAYQVIAKGTGVKLRQNS